MRRGIPVWLLAAVAASAPAFGQGTVAVNITGTVTDSAGAPLSGAAVKLEATGTQATSGADGRFTLSSSTSLAPAPSGDAFATLQEGRLALSLTGTGPVKVTAFGARGEALGSFERFLQAGSHSLALPASGPGVRFYQVQAGGREALVRAVALDGAAAGHEAASPAPLAKRSAAALYDVIAVTKEGYQTGYVTITKSDTANVKVALLKTTTPKFSFFVASMRTLQELAKSDKGFGGDLTFGETGPGAGLRGADKICATIAEKSFKGSSVKGWRAFLSVTADSHGKQVNAIDRVGPGPWYDRTGRLLAPTKADLLAVRPKNGDPTIQLDLPNEWGIPNHRPDPSKPQEDNHHMITGSDAQGRLYGANATCKDWTVAVHSAANGKPRCGFAWPRGGQVGASGSNWITSYDAPGCAPGVEIIDNGGGSATAIQQGWIGGGGGYGGFYCFALNP